MKRSVLFLSILANLVFHAGIATAEQFVLFDETFTFTHEAAVPTKSHLYVMPDQFGEGTPKNWTAPIDYRNGSVHVRIEVLEKPAGDEATTWSLCYIPNQGQKNGYGCTNTPTYTQEGVYEKDVSMTGFWNHDSIIWTEGIKKMALVIKDTSGGKGHAHKRQDHEKFFPTTIRVSMIQVSAGSTYDPAWLTATKQQANL